MIYQNLCPLCAAELQKVSDTKYACASCLNTYSSEKIEDYNDKLSKLFDSAKLELVVNAKQNLYSAISAEHISKTEVIRWCDEVKKYLPDDFQANFYYDFINAPKKEVAKNIRKIDEKEHFEALEPLIVFVSKSLEKSYVASIKDLIERAYKLGDRDLEKYVKYITLIENEAENVYNGVYDIKKRRKAFVAYSSIDSEKAIELVEELESQGITCFLSLRNLRHGVGSQENYDKFLKEAMDNCMSFVFVSSMNSRNFECDAYEIEMDYVMKKDIKNAPTQLQNFYREIPKEIKKPRVEYRIQESVGENYVDEFVDEFFDGYERVYTIKDVAQRLLRQSRRMDAPIFEQTPEPINEKKVKFCLECLTKCSFEAKFCQACGKTEFADTKKEAELIKKLNELQTQTDNAKANAEAKQAEALALQKKNEDLQKENQKLQDEKKALETCKDFGSYSSVQNNTKNKKENDIGNDFGSFISDHNKNNIKNKKAKNYFLYDPVKKKNILLSKLDLSTVCVRTGRYLSRFAASEGQIWSEKVLDTAEIHPEFKPLVAYKLLFSLADKDMDAGWKCLENASSKTIMFICEALNENSDFEFSNNFSRMMFEKPLNMNMIRDYLVRNKKYIASRMFKYVTENIEIFYNILD